MQIFKNLVQGFRKDKVKEPKEPKCHHCEHSSAQRAKKKGCMSDDIKYVYVWTCCKCKEVLYVSPKGYELV